MIEKFKKWFMNGPWGGIVSGIILIIITCTITAIVTLQHKVNNGQNAYEISKSLVPKIDNLTYKLNRLAYEVKEKNKDDSTYHIMFNWRIDTLICYARKTIECAKRDNKITLFIPLSDTLFDYPDTLFSNPDTIINYTENETGK